MTAMRIPWCIQAFCIGEAVFRGVVILVCVELRRLRKGVTRVSGKTIWQRAISAWLFFGAASLMAPAWSGTVVHAQTAPAKTPPAVGTIKNISTDSLTLAADSGGEIKVLLSADTKVFRVPPGSKDLKDAAAIQVADLQPGDRVLVRGKAGDAAQTFVASAVIVMKQGDIAQKRAKETEEWQRRGVGGLVKSVDAGNGTVTISTMTAAGNKDVAVHSTKETIVRRYAPGSVKFDDAKTGALTEIHAGDQLRARGTKSADGAQFDADEIVTGGFRNISGTIVSVDAAAGKMTVNDLAAKKTVEIAVTPDSQLRKLPAQMAQRLAARLKGDATGGGGAANGQNGSAATANPPAAPAQGGGANAGGGPGSGAGAGGGMGGGNRGGGGDMQQMLSRLPASTLGDFQKGDAVMIVASEGKNGGAVTLITLLGGVEPILQASPGQAASILTPWSMSSGGGDAGTP
jgi:hypothetical protein